MSTHLVAFCQVRKLRSSFFHTFWRESRPFLAIMTEDYRPPPRCYLQATSSLLTPCHLLILYQSLHVIDIEQSHQSSLHKWHLFLQCRNVGNKQHWLSALWALPWSLCGFTWSIPSHCAWDKTNLGQLTTPCMGNFYPKTLPASDQDFCWAWIMV